MYVYVFARARMHILCIQHACMHVSVCVCVYIHTWREKERESERARERESERARERATEREMFETVTRQRHSHTCTHLKVERMKQLVRGAPVSTDRIRAYAHFGNDRAGAKLAESTKFSNSDDAVYCSFRNMCDSDFYGVNIIYTL